MLSYPCGFPFDLWFQRMQFVQTRFCYLDAFDPFYWYNKHSLCECHIKNLAFYQEKAVSSNDGREIVNNELLEGHLGITRELLSYQSSQKKFMIGSRPDGNNLLKVVDLFFDISNINYVFVLE